MKRFVVTPSRCTACRTCELACSFRHGEGQTLGATRIRAFLFGEGKNVPLTCLQCEAAACVSVCPVAAVKRNDRTGAVEVLEGRCIGCRACVAACPFGAMAFLEEERVAYKCDLCGGAPACAQFCPTKALAYGEPPRRGA